MFSFLKESQKQILRASFLILAMSMLLISCSFNKMFLFPDPLEVGAYYTLRMSNNRSDTLQIHFEGNSQTPVFSKDPGCQIEVLQIPHPEGHTLYGWLITPPRNTEIRATVLFLHGNAGHLLSHFSLAHPLVQSGFQVLLFDYSGFGFSGSRATRQRVLTDGETALSYIKNRTDLKRQPLIIYGQSLGGNLAAIVATRHAEEVDALVIEGAFSSHDDIAVNHTGLGFIARIGVKEMYASKEEIQNWNKPLLVVHSTEDRVVPYEMGETIYEAAPGPKSFYTISGPHICGPMLYRDSIATKMGNMLNAYRK